jgi:PAS domain S-box-containing protein
MLKNSISVKIFFTVVSIIIVGFGFLTYTVIEQEKEDSLKEKRSAGELMAQPILYTIYKDMLDERADMVRHLIENMKNVKGTERVQIIRSNGIEEAFHDFKTLKAVEKEYGDLKPEWTAGHPNNENNIARGVDNPRFKEAIELFNKGRKEAVHYIEETDGKPLFTYLTPIEFRPKCNSCHSTKEEARGILMISTSLEEMYSTLASIRMRWIIYTFLTISGSGILLILFIRYTIKPLRRLSDAATDIANGNYDISMPVKSDDEIGILAASFNLMVHQIKNRTNLLNEENVRAVKAEETAKESRKKYEMLINSVDSIVWEADPATFQFTFVSEQAERLLGYPVEQWLNEPTFWKDHLHPDDRDQAVSYCMASTAKGGSYEFEYRMIAADGRFVWLQDIVSVISTNNQVVKLYGLLIDITEHKKAEEARFETQQKYEDLINNLNIGVYRRMLDGRLIEANPATVGMFEAGSREEFAKHNAIDFYKDKNKFKEVTSKLFKNGFIKNEELELLTTKGRLFWCSLSAVTKKDKDDNTYIDGIVEDISERKKLEEQLMHSQKMEAIGQLAGGIAHDFNNILTAILGYGNLLLRKRGSDDLVKEYADEIMRSAHRAAILTRDLLTLSRKHIINLQPSELNELIERVKKILTRLLGEHIKINTNLSNKDLIVKMDITQIEHVLLNLATNARDAMPNGGTITITASPVKLDKEFIDAHHYGKPGNYALITFADTGIGIDKNIQSRIFDPFFTTKEVGKGTGLGLSMAYGIIKQHDGYINVYSEPGSTVFNIYLPLMGEVSAAE